MSTPMTMTNCPSEETLAAFIDGRLDLESRRTVVDHMSSCEDCFSIVSAAWDIQAADAEAAPAPVVQGNFGAGSSWIWKATAALAASVVVVVALPDAREWIEFKRSGGMSAVVAAQEQMSQRKFEGRLAGDFSYKPLKRTFRGDNSSPMDDEKTWAMIEVSERLKKARSARSSRALADAHLALGEREEAIRAIESAASASPNDPAVLNDLAVAYLDRDRWRPSTADVSRALNAIERAWRIAKTPEIAFNRALALEKSDRRAEAIRAWQEYLALDPSSPWATDAQDHLKRVQTSD